MNDQLWSGNRPETYRLLSSYVDAAYIRKAAFLALYPAPVLLVDEHANMAEKGKFGTTAVAKVSKSSRSITESTCVIPIAKRGASPAGGAAAKTPRFIWVGRQPSCDVWLPFDGISKLHAQFVRREDGKLELADAGSKNGTFIGPTQVQRTAEALPDRAQIRFGLLEVTYLSPERFWEELGMFAKLLAAN